MKNRFKFVKSFGGATRVYIVSFTARTSKDKEKMYRQIENFTVNTLTDGCTLDSYLDRGGVWIQVG